MDPANTMPMEIREATAKYLAELTAKRNSAREKVAASQREYRSNETEEEKASRRADDAAAHQRARSDQTEEEKSSARAKNAAAHTAARERATSEYQEECRAAEAQCHLGMMDAPPPAALLHHDTCPNAIIALLAFWEQSGLESIPHVSEIRDLQSFIQAAEKRREAALARFRELLGPFKAAVAKFLANVGIPEKIRDILLQLHAAIPMDSELCVESLCVESIAKILDLLPQLEATKGASGSSSSRSVYGLGGGGGDENDDEDDDVEEDDEDENDDDEEEDENDDDEEEDECREDEQITLATKIRDLLASLEAGGVEVHRDDEDDAYEEVN